MPLNFGQSALLHLDNCNMGGPQVGDRKEKTASAEIVRFLETVQCDSRGDSATKVGEVLMDDY